MDAVITGEKLAWAPAGGMAVLRSATIMLRRGEVVALQGSSGAGKTVLGTLLLGLRKPTSGAVSWAGSTAVGPAAPPAVRRRYQMLPQHTAALLPPFQKVRAALGETARWVRGEPVDIEGHPWLARLGCGALLDREPGTLSGGEQRRLSLLRVLLAEPHFAFVDEPDAGQDPETAEEVLALIAQWSHERGVAALVVTHHAGLAARYADRRCELCEGVLDAV